MLRGAGGITADAKNGSLVWPDLKDLKDLKDFDWSAGTRLDSCLCAGVAVCCSACLWMAPSASFVLDPRVAAQMCCA